MLLCAALRSGEYRKRKCGRSNASKDRKQPDGQTSSLKGSSEKWWLRKEGELYCRMRKEKQEARTY